VTSLAALGLDIPMPRADAALASAFETIFGPIIPGIPPPEVS
jgi:hypothetical protein